jgi:heme exporter protein A
VATPSRGHPPAQEGSPLEAGTALEAVGLVREFGALRAVDGVSFSLLPGEHLTVFGPNGAGKTTLLQLLSGALRATAGEVRSGGIPVRTGDLEWNARVGVLSHQGFLYGHLTAEENLRFHADLHLLSDPAERVAAGLRAVGLALRARDRVRGFSRGMRQRLALARTLLHEPEVVLLDEPYTGLDAHAAGLLRDVLASLRDGRRTVVLVTHNLTQGLEQADRVAIQVRGRFEVLDRRGALPSEGFEGFYRGVVEEAEGRG